MVRSVDTEETKSYIAIIPQTHADTERTISHLVVLLAYFLDLLLLFLHISVQTPQVDLLRVGILDRFDERGDSFDILRCTRCRIESDLRDVSPNQVLEDEAMVPSSGQRRDRDPSPAQAVFRAPPM